MCCGGPARSSRQRSAISGGVDEHAGATGPSIAVTSIPVVARPHRISAQVHVRAHAEQRRRQLLGISTTSDGKLDALEHACTDCAKWSFSHTSQHLAQLQAWETNARHAMAQLQKRSDKELEHTQLELANTVRALQLKHANALSHLESVHAAARSVGRHLDKLQSDEAEIFQRECEIHTQMRSRTFARNTFEERQNSLLGRITEAQQCLDELKPTNPFNDAFHIWHSGPFGTINKLRLGHIVTAPTSPSPSASRIKGRARSHTISVARTAPSPSNPQSPAHAQIHSRRQSSAAVVVTNAIEATRDVKQEHRNGREVSLTRIVPALGLAAREGLEVTWEEMNTAWGQAALLLCAIARTTNYTFKAYSIDPLGSRSRVTPFLRSGAAAAST
jgi:hypothetical protein